MPEDKNEEFKTELSKFNLQENDVLVIKVDISNLQEDKAKNRLYQIRHDDFVKYIEDNGNKVFVTYSGVDLNILRMEENDKLVAYVDVSQIDEDSKESYLDYLKFKMESTIGEEKVLIVPVKNNSPVLKVVKKGENDEHKST